MVLLVSSEANTVALPNTTSYDSSELIIDRTDSSLRALERAQSPQPIGSTYRSRVDTEHAPRAAGDIPCCSTGCKGQDCVHARVLLNKLAAELLSLDSGVELLLQKEHSLSIEVGVTPHVVRT